VAFKTLRVVFSWINAVEDHLSTQALGARFFDMQLKPKAHAVVETKPRIHAAFGQVWRAKARLFKRCKKMNSLTPRLGACKRA
jgi:hypothetical protein